MDLHKLLVNCGVRAHTDELEASSGDVTVVAGKRSVISAAPALVEVRQGGTVPEVQGCVNNWCRADHSRMYILAQSLLGVIGRVEWVGPATRRKGICATCVTVVRPVNLDVVVAVALRLTGPIGGERGRAATIDPMLPIKLGL